MPAGSKANVESQPCGRWICSFELPDDQPCREIPFEARGRLLRQQGGELKNSEQRCSGKRGNANGHGTSRLRIKFCAAQLCDAAARFLCGTASISGAGPPK